LTNQTSQREREKIKINKSELYIVVNTLHFVTVGNCVIHFTRTKNRTNWIRVFLKYLIKVNFLSPSDLAGRLKQFDYIIGDVFEPMHCVEQTKREKEGGKTE
jgi:hypothetical protein